MQPDQVTIFLSQYPDPVFNNALKLRKLLLNALSGINEQLDLPARVIGYGYGQKYSETICVLIPSKKGIKLVSIKEMNYQIQIIYLKALEKLVAMLRSKTKSKLCLPQSKTYSKAH